MKVLKFGGTSIGCEEGLERIIRIVKSELKECNGIVVVVSALSGVTNSLIIAGKSAERGELNYQALCQEIKTRHISLVTDLFCEIDKVDYVINKMSVIFQYLENIVWGIRLIQEMSKRTCDALMSIGEQLSAIILTEYAKECGVNAKFCDARDFIKTDENFGNATVLTEISSAKIRDFFSLQQGVDIVTGFIGSTSKGETTTLGRGASDFTASLLGSVLEVEEIQLWSDVDGVMTANPQKVLKAFPIAELSYAEAMELSHFGTKVLYAPTVQPAKEKNIPIRLLNTFNINYPGTIVKDYVDLGKYAVKGITSITDIALLRIEGSGMVGVAGISYRLFGSLAHAGISVIMIIQASSEHSICLAVSTEIADKAADSIDLEFKLEIKAGLIDKTIIEKDKSIIAVVGDNMKKSLGIAGSLFSALGRNGVNVLTIAQGSSELNISFVVEKNDEVKALNAIHEAFFVRDQPTANLFIIGTGNIGQTLLDQINKIANRRQNFPALKVIAIANSRKMYFDQNGIDLSEWQLKLDSSGESMDFELYWQKMKSLNLPNSIFVDNTANSLIASNYLKILQLSTSIVTPNKLFNVGKYADYKYLRQVLNKYKIHFFYETNVGAGLPVISTMRDLLNSGDSITKIEGVFSGTLSYIFNSFSEGKQFSNVVKEAMLKGYTEPDPRLDLNGIDIARKILILARELDIELELDDVAIEKLLPTECFKVECTDDFLKEIEKRDDYFETLRKDAQNKNCALRYVAELENGKARVFLKAVDKEHAFYSIQGSDNIIAFSTERYKQTPLVIKGAGAGAEVTAAGVLADILKVAQLILKG